MIVRRPKDVADGPANRSVDTDTLRRKGLHGVVGDLAPGGRLPQRSGHLHVRPHMTHRPAHIWLVLALLAAFTLWLLYGVAAALIYFQTKGVSLSLMRAYVPVLIGACACALAWVALFRRRRWVRWLFLLPVVAAALQLLAIAPYVLMLFRPIADPAAKASIRHVAGGVFLPVVFLLVSIAVAISVFRYFRAAKPSPVIRAGTSGEA